MATSALFLIVSFQLLRNYLQAFFFPRVDFGDVLFRGEPFVDIGLFFLNKAYSFKRCSGKEHCSDYFIVD